MVLTMTPVLRGQTPVPAGYSFHHDPNRPLQMEAKQNTTENSEDYHQCRMKTVQVPLHSSRQTSPTKSITFIHITLSWTKR